MFYDESVDLNQLFEEAEQGDIGAMLRCVSYIYSVGDDTNPVLKGLCDKYIDELVKKEMPAGFIWKAEKILSASMNKEAVKAAMSCYYLAALNGDYYGIECIADMYYEGKGVEVNWIIARSIFWSAIRLIEEGKSIPSPMTFFKLGRIEEEAAEEVDDIEYAIYLYRRAIWAAGDFAEIDDYAVKAQEALWRLCA